ncbi:helix-turn-helix transcriptional regulator [Streptomyces sp. NPDC047024]|uniref:helix-turn-helix domain-containing protein n=1 Tax=Streptomyces sp. NPDC047024 TaxID=3155476 RepID=UPI0034009B5A
MLRGARQRSGLGLREVARQAGLSSGYVADLEAGRRCPSVTVAQRLVEVLGLVEGDRAQLLTAAVTDAGRDNPLRAPADA